MSDSDNKVPSYSRDEVVAELSSYYEFLTRIFLPPSVVRYPPEGGWEHINRDWMKTFALGKNDTVIDLMRHIPYIRRDEVDDFEPWQIFERTTAVDCAGDRALNFPGESRREFLFEGWTIKVPAHVYVLANHPTGRDGHHIFIDTARGTVILADVQVGPKPTKLSQVDSPPGDEEWQEHATYTVTGFFSKLKKMWRNFELHAIERRSIELGPPDKGIMRIYRQEGLFTEGYDRERCMDRVERYVNLEYFHFRPIAGKRKHGDISE
ncbi:hypothetical protein GCG54_00004369 [Colletotrichum gloeosporioides]|uniref:Uncharacterized protein n=1 Tax=Colletotrichum gloeosporioides TaxID=474922 RepID=A0A8H4FM72_COLGL|nr:uncharacterized protein GCG54_00004369 [Colletotrichum gloeosporioides]KAF3806044.1 hypothetical protein GCG54_00004369 [Colletotrichum gloeosporioides]